jgi:YesN/AraC family two-component response regulator
MIVDDEKIIREGIRRSLGWQALGVGTVRTAASAADALALFGEGKFDLMITDINMAEVSGLELIEKVRDTLPKLRIIVLTGYDRFEYARTALKLHVNEFLLKPVDEDELAKAVKEQLDALEDRPELNLFYDVFGEFKAAMVKNVGDAGRVLHILDRLYSALENYHLSEEDAVRSLYDIAGVVTFAYMKASGEDAGGGLSGLSDLLIETGREEAYKITRMYLTNLLQAQSAQNADIIMEAKRYMSETMTMQLTVAQVADHLHVSAGHLSKLFKKETGMGCNEFINAKRIEKACSLLETTSLPTGFIGEKVGYGDVNYFSAVFKRHTGVSPRRYREMRRGG